MEKVFSFILAIAISQTGFSQISIDGSGFILPGTSLNYENASPVWLLNQDLLSTDGENAVWNIGDWQFLDSASEVYGSLDTVSFVNQLIFHNQFLYPQSFSTVVLSVGQGIINLPIPIDISDAYSFFRKDETGYYNTGTSFAVSGFPLATPNDTVERIYKFPMHFGDTDASTLSYLISLPTLGAYGQYATRESEVDGSGILNTPYGSYDVLRVRAVRHITDTLYIEQFGTGQTVERPEQIDYAWLSPDVAGPVFKMSVINGVVVSAQLLNDNVISGIAENQSEKFEVYPNPAKQFISIKARNPVLSLTIYDSVGKIVLSKETEINSVNIHRLNQGIYFLKLQFSNHTTAIQKLIVTE